MRTEKTNKPSANRAPVRDLQPRDDRNVKAGEVVPESISINFTKIEYKYTPYDNPSK